MFKNLVVITFGIIVSLVFAAAIQAAGVSVRLSAPKSPTNQNTFDINFVTLDVGNNPITVKCLKKGPSDGGFSQFGGDINLAAGGNSGNCAVGGSVMGSNGSYQFQASANNGSETVTSNIVTVDYNTSGPDTPTNYGKEKISSCIYRIKFRTANDGGKTVKVEVYRSENTSFNADGGTRVATVSIGSNTDGSADINSPDCNKEYFFVVRAFDSAGNGSGLVGDSKTVTVTTGATETSVASAAISTGGGVGGAILGEKSEEEAGEIKGEATEEAETATPAPLGQPSNGEGGNLFSARNLIIALVILMLAAFGILLYRRGQKVE